MRRHFKVWKDTSKQAWRCGLLWFAMIKSIVKSFKVPDVDVVAARMSNESALTCMTDSPPKNLGQT